MVTEEPQQPESQRLSSEILPAPAGKALSRAPQPAPSAAVTAPAENPFVDRGSSPYAGMGIRSAGYSSDFLSLHLSPLYIQTRAGMKGSSFQLRWRAVQPSQLSRAR